MRFVLSFLVFVTAWLVQGAAFACTSNEIDVLGDGTQCETAKFSVTTTSSTDSFAVGLTAIGNFYIDWGDGTVESVSRTDTTDTTYSHNYATADQYTIRFGGVATGYYDDDGSASENIQTIRFPDSAVKIDSISGSLATLFPQLGSDANQIPCFRALFNGATHLTSVPSGLFTGLTGGARDMFKNTFRGCTNLSVIPDGLFSGITTGASNMFAGAFQGCTSLATIPSGLFSGITTGAPDLFRGTFQGCTSLATIPSGLFSGITTAANSMFRETFSGCTNLSGYIPPTTFAGLIANGHPVSYDMWYATFNNTQLATTCPSPTEQYITGYEGSWGGRVSCGCAKGTYGDGTTCTACANTKPANSSWTGGATTSTCAWLCDPGYVNNGTSCVAATFSVTTTALTANQTISFKLTAIGTFYVNWGDGYEQTITRTGTSEQTYTHTYGAAGTYTIGFAGTATGYNTGNSTPAITFSTDTKTRIASISGSLGVMFPYLGSGSGQYPRFYGTFSGCTNLTTISSNLFSGITTAANYMFRSTFQGCTSLATIPTGLFSGITTGATELFRSTFQGCTSLATIPSGLFSGITTGAGYMFTGTFQDCTSLGAIPDDLFSGITTGAERMFSNTFYGCTSLATIPTGLFSGITTGARDMFNSTFFGCTSLGAIPSGLFSGITTAANTMFKNAFNGCTNLSGYIPPTTFAGLIANQSPTATDMWADAFKNTNLATTCPSPTEQYITRYEGSWGGRVSCGCAKGTYGDGTTCTACANTKPANSSWTGGATTSTCAWLCDPGYVNNGTSCVASTFSVTTTALTANQTISFKLSAIGTFYVSWGDGSEQTITRTGTSEQTYTHTYGAAGTYTIGFAGTATGYNTGSSTPAISFSTDTKTRIASVSGSLGVMFPYLGSGSGQNPRFYGTFSGCTNLTTISSNLFSGITTGATNMFYGTFSGCSSLSAIPSGLFSGITTGAQSMFKNTFSGCTNLTTVSSNLFNGITTGATEMFMETFKGCTSLATIPSGLFSGITTEATDLFRGTFQGCTSLATIPSGLFSGITTGASGLFSNTFNGCTSLATIPTGLFSGITTGATNMFNSTFKGCTSLATIPSGLFSGITTAANTMFRETFSGCTNLSGYIPPTTFAGLIANQSPTATDMWTDTFTSTNLATSCANWTSQGMTQYTTGYESSWDGSVSCACVAGTYDNGGTCTQCTGATYSRVAATSCTACPTGYTANTTAGKTSVAQCQINCAAGTYVANSFGAADAAYTPLEYIKTTGTQYIRTPYKVSDLVNPVMSVTLKYALGAAGRNGASNFWVGLNNGGSGELMRCVGSASGTQGTLRPHEQTKHTIILDAQNSTCSLSGEGITSEVTVSDLSTNNNYIGVGAFGNGDNKAGTVEYYNFNLISNGVEIMNLVPARRKSDNVLGMYDTVSGAFFTNTGTGDFVAGPDVVTACVNVGAGFYTGASVVNYGSAGTRTACPAGTYNNTTNGASLAACTACSGATYNDATAATSCTACPTGYTYNTTPGKTSIEQCQTQCEPGSYLVAKMPSGFTQLEYVENSGTSYINTNVSSSSGVVIKGEIRISTPNAVTKNTNLLGAQRDGSKGYSIGWDKGFKIWIDEGSIKKTGPNHALSAGTTHDVTYEFDDPNLSLSLRYDGTNTTGTYSSLGNANTIHLFEAGNHQSGREFQGRIHYFKLYEDGALVHEFVPARRESDSALGMYDTVEGEFAEATGTMTAGPDVVGMAECKPVGPGYYAATSMINYGSVGTRGECPAGTTTVGYGHGADSADDCGRILHIGDYVLYTNRSKQTTPALNIKMPNGDMHYIGLSSSNHNLSRLHLSYGGNEFTAYDDSLFYGERNFDTGAQIVSTP